MPYTHTYRRDLPRRPDGPLYKHDTEHWHRVLAFLETHRGTVLSPTPPGNVSFYYRYGRLALDEVGVDVSAFPEEIDSLPPPKARRTLQRLLTRLSQVFDPQDRSNPPQVSSGTVVRAAAQQEKSEEQGEDEGEDEDTEEDEGDGEDEEEDEEQNGMVGSSANTPSGMKEEEAERAALVTGGGGEQTYADAKDVSIFQAVRHLIGKLAEHDDPTVRLPYGQTTWDVKRLLLGHWNPLVYDDAKLDYGKQVDHIYLILDTSGSVSHLAGTIAAVAAASAGIVHLYTGSEAHPQYKVERASPLRSPADPFPEWRKQTRIGMRATREEREWVLRFINQTSPQYPEWKMSYESFESSVAWFLHREKPPKGSRILFWGDTEYVNIQSPRLLRSLLHPYRAAWLLSNPFKEQWSPENDKEWPPERLLMSPSLLDDPEWPKLRAVNIPVLENVTNAEGFRACLSALQMVR